MVAASAVSGPWKEVNVTLGAMLAAMNAIDAAFENGDHARATALDCELEDALEALEARMEEKESESGGEECEGGDDVQFPWAGRSAGFGIEDFEIDGAEGGAPWWHWHDNAVDISTADDDLDFVVARSHENGR